MDENAVAPTGESTPLNTNPEAATPATPAEPQAPAEPQYFTPEEAKEIKSFLDNNGGFERVKKNLTMRQTDMQPQTQPQAPAPEVQPQTPQPQQPAPQPLAGGISTEEFMTQQYFESLSKREEYANIADQIRSGEVLKQLAEFNIPPVVNGYFNQEGVIKFLNLYAKTVPAKAPDAPITTTPTVDLVQVGETIDSMDAAMAVLAQDRQLRSMGRDGHPMAKAANEFFDAALNKQANRGRVEHKTLAELQKK